MKSLIKAIIILPGTAGVLVPAIILYYEHSSNQSPLFSLSVYDYLTAILFFALGLYLVISTIRLFVESGKGTPAPWDPPKELVIEGPYLYVRNPMITGMISILIGESFIFNSAGILWWALVFFIANSFYFPFIEEKELEKRFGEKYLEYKKNVPRWIPRVDPWNQKQ